MTIGERVKEARKRKGMTQDELAKALGYKSKSSVAHIENERDIPRSMIEKLAKILDTTPSYLMGWEEQPTSSTIHMLHPAISLDLQPVNFWGKVSAGVGAYADGVPLRTMYAETDDLQSGYDYAWLEVDGDSMTPDLQDGDYLLVRVQDTAQTGDLVVAMINTGTETIGVVKRLELVDGSHLTLISINPAYPPRVFVGECMNDVRIFGVVVSSKRKWR